MNIQSFFDTANAYLYSRIIRKNKYFADNSHGKSVSEIIKFAEKKYDLYNIDIENHKRKYFNIKYEEYNFNPFYRRIKKSGSRVFLVYHHSNNEIPPEKAIFKISKYLDVNIGLIGGAFHTNKYIYMKKLRDINNFTGLIASSAILMNDIAKVILKSGYEKVILAGTSLGGFVTIANFLYLDSKDTHISFYSGYNPYDVFLNGEYRYVLSENAGESIKSELSFEKDFAGAVNKSNIYFLNGKYDKYINYLKQTEYALNKILVNKSHYFGIRSYKQIASFMKRFLD
ncbi:MAG: hypothetical protein H7A30_01345 [Thermotogae bacterium]|nr:hypothetical protein [Thermotogota bacterium]